MGYTPSASGARTQQQPLLLSQQLFKHFFIKQTKNKTCRPCELSVESVDFFRVRLQNVQVGAIMLVQWNLFTHTRIGNPTGYQPRRLLKLLNPAIVFSCMVLLQLPSHLWMPWQSMARKPV